MTDKRFQVFVSSTFKDLVEERQHLLKAVLELGHMPAGMELFPASDEDAWRLIEGVIDSSDYYVLVIGGRYGSQDVSGISYTEKEYDYAVAKRIQVVPLLHKNPDNLQRERTETEPILWEKLQAFRRKVEAAHTCTYWTSPLELKAQLIVALTAALRRKPGIGWVRADTLPPQGTIEEILRLRTQLDGLRKELDESRARPPEGAQGLAQGDDALSVRYQYEGKSTLANNYDFAPATTYEGNMEVTWNQVFAHVSPWMIDEFPDRRLRSELLSFLNKAAREQRQVEAGVEATSFPRCDDSVVGTIFVQLRALGLIEESKRKRSVTDTTTYWILTPYGDDAMTRLKAIRKPHSSEPLASGS